MVPRDALGHMGTLRVRGVPLAKKEPQGTVPPAVGWAGIETRAAQGLCPHCWASSPFCLLLPIPVTLLADFQCFSPAPGWVLATSLLWRLLRGGGVWSRVGGHQSRFFSCGCFGAM